MIFALTTTDQTMQHLLKKVFVLSMCMSMAACTSMRIVADGRDAVDTVARDAAHGLHAGETLLVHTRDGQPQAMVYDRTEGNELVGRAGSADVHIDIAKVVRIERKESDGLKTAGIAGGAVALFAALLAGAKSEGRKIGENLGDAYTGKGKR